jgi:hypothetical protein
MNHYDAPRFSRVERRFTRGARRVFGIGLLLLANAPGVSAVEHHRLLVSTLYPEAHRIVETHIATLGCADVQFTNGRRHLVGTAALFEIAASEPSASRGCRGCSRANARSGARVFDARLRQGP